MGTVTAALLATSGVLGALYGFAEPLVDYFKSADQVKLARYGCRQLGLTVYEAKAAICPPRVHRLVSMGARAIIAGEFRYPIVDGVVKTCLSKGMWN
ncbi:MULTISPECIES: hypothetical protein [unclassified Aureimonas]|uniref:hypothetical protein n=1 Tax=unclassified Aureimonas TaxID=2615206 RepID=UPI0006F95A8D|nr:MULTISPECIES: hypothetical protein [unclassified Aureimonas]